MEFSAAYVIPFFGIVVKVRYHFFTADGTSLFPSCDTAGTISFLPVVYCERDIFPLLECIRREAIGMRVAVTDGLIEHHVSFAIFWRLGYELHERERVGPDWVV